MSMDDRDFTDAARHLYRRTQPAWGNPDAWEREPRWHRDEYIAKIASIVSDLEATGWVVARTDRLPLSPHGDPVATP